MIIGARTDKIIEKKELDYELRLKRFAIWFALSFVLNGYASGIPGISLGSIVFIIMILLSIARSMQLSTANHVLSFCVVFLTISFVGMLLNGLRGVSFGEHFVSVAKFALWGLMISNVAAQRYDFATLSPYIKKMGYVLIIYLLIQNIGFYVFHFYFPNIFRFLFLQPYAEGYADYEALSRSSILRPGSLLSESSFLGNYLLCMLALEMEDGVRNGKNISINIIVISIAIILSSSTSAIVLFPIVWLVYWKKIKKDNKSKLIGFLMIIVVIVPLIIIIVPNIIGGRFASSMQYAFNKFSRLDSMTRFGKSFNYLQYLHGTNLWFGVGLGNDDSFLMNQLGLQDVYLNSVTSILISTGIVGCTCFFIFAISLLIRSVKYKNKLSLILLVIYLIKGFSSGMYFSTYGVMFMFVVCGELYYSSYYKKASFQQ